MVRAWPDEGSRGRPLAKAASGAPRPRRADPEALRALHAHGGAIPSASSGACSRDRAAAEDVQQQVFLEAWQHRERFDPERGGLLHLAAPDRPHAALDHLRRRVPAARPGQHGGASPTALRRARARPPARALAPAGAHRLPGRRGGPLRRRFYPGQQPDRDRGGDRPAARYREVAHGAPRSQRLRRGARRGGWRVNAREDDRRIRARRARRARAARPPSASWRRTRSCARRSSACGRSSPACTRSTPSPGNRRPHRRCACRTRSPPRRGRRLALRPAVAAIAAVLLAAGGCRRGACSSPPATTRSRAARSRCAPLPAGGGGHGEAAARLAGGRDDARRLAASRPSRPRPVLRAVAAQLRRATSSSLGLLPRARLRATRRVEPFPSAGRSRRDYRFLDLSVEPDDGDPSHSSRSVLRGRT